MMSNETAQSSFLPVYMATAPSPITAPMMKVNILGSILTAKGKIMKLNKIPLKIVATATSPNPILIFSAQIYFNVYFVLYPFSVFFGITWQILKSEDCPGHEYPRRVETFSTGADSLEGLMVPNLVS